MHSGILLANLYDAPRTRMSQEWDMSQYVTSMGPFNQVVQIFPLENHEARRSSAGKPAGTAVGEGVNPVESVGRGHSSRGSSCLGLGSWGNTSSFSQPCSLLFTSRKSEQDRNAHGPTASSAPISVSSSRGEEDDHTSAAPALLIRKSEGSDRLTPLQQAVSATSSAFFKMGSWSSRARGRAVSLDIPPPATPPLQQDIACYMSNPLHRQPPLSPSTSSSVRSCQVTQGCLNNRMHPAGSNERNVQPQQLKPCLSRSLERNIIKRVSFEPLESTDVAGGSPGEWDAWARSSDYRPYSTRRSRDAPTCPEIPSFSSQDPPSPDSSARSCSARSRSSAGTYFFQGTLGRSRRCSSASDRAPRASERSEAGDGDATEAQSSCVEEEVSGSELEFYQFAKPFDPGVEDELQPYACSPPGDEGDTAIVDHAGCVVRRVKRGAGKRARRYGYMLEAEQIERCCATGGMAGRESWPVKLANAIVASNSPHFVE